jgi:hypothetical protein
VRNTVEPTVLAESECKNQINFAEAQAVQNLPFIQ